MDQDKNESIAVGRWSTGLYECYEDPSSCIKTCCCPCVTFGQNAEIIDRNNTSCCCGGLLHYILLQVGCACVYSYSFRKKLREQYSLPEKPCGDFCVHWCCHCCALCQEQRELKNRGLDPSKGWEANARKINRASVTMVPPVHAQDMPR